MGSGVVSRVRGEGRVAPPPGTELVSAPTSQASRGSYLFELLVDDFSNLVRRLNLPREQGRQHVPQGHHPQDHPGEAEAVQESALVPLPHSPHPTPPPAKTAESSTATLRVKPRTPLRINHYLPRVSVWQEPSSDQTPCPWS